MFCLICATLCSAIIMGFYLYGPHKLHLISRHCPPAYKTPPLGEAPSAPPQTPTPSPRPFRDRCAAKVALLCGPLLQGVYTILHSPLLHTPLTAIWQAGLRGMIRTRGIMSAILTLCGTGLGKTVTRVVTAFQIIISFCAVGGAIHIAHVAATAAADSAPLADVVTALAAAVARLALTELALAAVLAAYLAAAAVLSLAAGTVSRLLQQFAPLMASKTTLGSDTHQGDDFERPNERTEDLQRMWARLDGLEKKNLGGGGILFDDAIGFTPGSPSRIGAIRNLPEIYTTTTDQTEVTNNPARETQRGNCFCRHFTEI